ncbi:MAG TPA: penicillin acylase family protein [Gemmatimonadaceae bacterium]|jgi:acyl-homoserine-lactone acylase
MKTIALLLAAGLLSVPRQLPLRNPTPERSRLEREARNVTITRDSWGIPHVHGKTDADAVFGLVYAQAEDDFNRVETNFINAMGRLAEAEGEREIYRDLRMKLFIDPDTLKAQYASSPEWLKALMNGWADGLNYYLQTHPDVKPRVIGHFEPWMALSFSEGSIGGDIERVNLDRLEAFYGNHPEAEGRTSGTDEEDEREMGIPNEPTGSNGVAIAPANTVDHHALLLINPHTSFFFRAEVQVTSDEGLDAYGAVTWGQFFVYQGFNEHVGWMHTSSGVDAIDEYLETVEKHGDKYFYKYGNEWRPVTVSTITVPYKTGTGLLSKSFAVYRTHHGPIIREQNGKWVAVRLMNSPEKALTQSYTRTKARDYKSFKQSMELHTNSSNNTIFADKDGDIAYFHGNFIPRRNPKFDWTKPVDGSDTATEWHGVLSVDETPHLLNPTSGWLYNSNNWPWSAAGASSPKRGDYPAYVETGNEESWRGYHAIRVLSNRKNFSIAALRAAAYDSYLPAFEKMIPPLLASYDQLPASDPLKAKLADQIAQLRAWDYRWGVASVPTSLAVFWGEEVTRRVAPEARRVGMSPDQYAIERATPQQRLDALAAASDKLAADFGAWKTAWRDINRFQRLTGDIVQPFNDAGPSTPVGFTSSRWGSLASFGARPYPGTKKWYGTSGNSFVAVVEFGDSIRAIAVTAGGESGHAGSPHFNDEAQRYATGNLREVYFYPSQLKAHTEKVYHPGER